MIPSAKNRTDAAIVSNPVDLKISDISGVAGTESEALWTAHNKQKTQRAQNPASNVHLVILRSMRPALTGIAEFFVSTIIRSSSLEMFMLGTPPT
jgi:hypothetical protein